MRPISVTHTVFPLKILRECSLLEAVRGLPKAGCMNVTEI